MHITSLHRPIAVAASALLLAACGGSPSAASSSPASTTVVPATTADAGTSPSSTAAPEPSTTPPTTEAPTTTVSVDEFCDAYTETTTLGARLQGYLDGTKDYTHQDVVDAIDAELEAIDSVFATAPAELADDVKTVLTTPKGTAEIIAKYGYDPMKVYGSPAAMEEFSRLPVRDQNTVDAIFRLRDWTTAHCGAARS